MRSPQHKSTFFKSPKKLCKDSVRTSRPLVKNKKNTKRRGQSHELSQLLAGNEQKLQLLESKLQKQVSKKPVRRTRKKSPKQVPVTAYFHYMQGLTVGRPAVQRLFDQSFRAFNASQATPNRLIVNLMRFAAALIKASDWKPSPGKSSVLPTTDSFMTPAPPVMSSDSSLSFTTEQSQDCRLAQLSHEIQENLSRTKTVLKNSYASATQAKACRTRPRYHRGKTEF